MKENAGNFQRELLALTDAVQALAGNKLDQPVPESRILTPLAEALEMLRQQMQNDRAEQQKTAELRRNSISSIVHDLRGPLTAILGYAEALQQGIAKTPAKKDAYLSAIQLRARDLSRLADQLSAANKAMGRLLIHPAPCCFADAIRTCASEWTGFLHDTRTEIRMTLDASLTVLLDKDVFLRLFANLLSNTVKYRKKAYSLVRLGLAEKNGKAVFSYADDGPGVSPEALPHLFEPWFRASADVPGSGLGLYIAAQVAAAHHGAIRAFNHSGLVIEIELPLAGGSSC